MVNSLENIDKSKVSATRIEGLEGVVEDTISNTLTGAVSTITTSDLTANKILISDGNGKVAASAKAISDIPNDSDVVHLSGTETITGDKTFTGQTTFNRNDNDISLVNKYTNYTKGTTPSNNQYSGIRMYDSAGTEVSDFYCRITTDNLHLARIVLKDPGTGTANTRIGLYYPADGTPYSEAPTPTSSATGNTSSTEIATCGWVNTLDSGVVHTSGNETINGAKTFNDRTNFVKYIYSGTTEINSGVTVQKTNVTKGTTPTDNYNNRFLLQSKDGVTVNQRLASLDLVYTTENETSAVLSAYKPEFDSTTRAGIGVYYPATGDPYTYAPTPATSDNSTQIATTAFVKAQGYAVDSGLVHTSGNETIAGTKTFSSTISGSINGNAATVTNGVYTNTAQTISATKTFTANQIITKAKPVLQLKDTSITRNTAPSAAVNSITINGLDSAGKNTWGIYHTWGTDKKAQTQLICYKGTSTDNTFSAIGVGYDASGNAFTNAPTPAVADNSTKIATTAFVNTKFKKVSALPASPDANTYYFIAE